MNVLFFAFDFQSTFVSICAHTFVRSPSTPDLSADELPDDITTDIADIPNDLELNQEDFSDVLPRLPDDLQDFDLFEGNCTQTHTFSHTFFFVLEELSANIYIILE